MKVKTSISLSDDVLGELDDALGADESRSALIERLVKRHLRELHRSRDFGHQVELLNGIADGPEPPDEVEDPFELGDPAALVLNDAHGAG